MTATAVTTDQQTSGTTTRAWSSRRARVRAWVGRGPALRLLIPVLAVALLAAGGWRVFGQHGPAAYLVPQSPSIEAAFGIRFNQVNVVGDGGLVELGYTVLDSEKASAFQSDTKHPPQLHSEARAATVSISALMKQGHTLRPGQTYFIIYENPKNAIRPGETVTIDDKGQRLAHVPVR